MFTGTIKCSTCKDSFKTSKVEIKYILRWLRQHDEKTHIAF